MAWPPSAPKNYSPDEMGKVIKELANGLAPRTYQILNVTPKDTEGMEGERRVLKTGGLYYALYKIDGVWKKTQLT